MTEKNNSSKSFDWGRWLGVFIALGALAYAHLAYQTSKSALDFQREQARKQRETVIELESWWVPEKVFFSGFQKTYLTIEYVAKEEKFLGVEFFRMVKIYNASEHPVSVDGVAGGFIYKNWFNSQLASNRCFAQDFVTEIQFPFTIEPNQQKRVLIRIPIPFHEQQRRIFEGLSPDSLYTAEQIIQQYNQGSTVYFHGNDYPFILMSIIKSQLIPPDSTATWEQHRFLVSIALASGVRISKNFHIIFPDLVGESRIHL